MLVKELIRLLEKLPDQSGQIFVFADGRQQISHRIGQIVPPGDTTIFLDPIDGTKYHLFLYGIAMADPWIE